MNKRKIPCTIDTRRRLISACVFLPAIPWWSSVRAQVSARVSRIGLLSPFSASDAAPWYQAFRERLRNLGWVEGKNISIEYRYAEGSSARLPELAADLVRLNVEVIVTTVNTDALAAKTATKTIPIVMAGAGEPVATGLVESLARPGGNITGLSQMAVELGGKRLELLKEMVPKLSRVAVLWNPQTSISMLAWKEIQLPARQLGLQLHSVEIQSINDLDKAFDALTKMRIGAIAIMPDPMFTANLKRIADLAGKHRIPSTYNVSEFADAGGLMTYGPERLDMYRRAAVFVDKILKGAKPGDLPVEQPILFELAINTKSAKALGIKIPPSVMVRATRLIE